MTRPLYVADQNLYGRLLAMGGMGGCTVRVVDGGEE